MPPPDAPILDYSRPPAKDSLAILRTAVHIIVLFDVLIFALFVVAAETQFQQPDPSNTHWMDVKVFSMDAFAALWFVALVGTGILSAHSRSLHLVAYLWLIIAGILVFAFLAGMCLFLFVPWIS